MHKDRPEVPCFRGERQRDNVDVHKHTKVCEGKQGGSEHQDKLMVVVIKVN